MIEITVTVESAKKYPLTQNDLEVGVLYEAHVRDLNDRDLNDMPEVMAVMLVSLSNQNSVINLQTGRAYYTHYFEYRKYSNTETISLRNR